VRERNKVARNDGYDKEAEKKRAMKENRNLTVFWKQQE
jgi:hypothetical protein